MIVRMWHGRTPKIKANAYKEFIKSKAISDYQSVEGNLGLTFLTGMTVILLIFY